MEKNEEILLEEFNNDPVNIFIYSFEVYLSLNKKSNIDVALLANKKNNGYDLKVCIGMYHGIQSYSYQISKNPMNGNYFILLWFSESPLGFSKEDYGNLIIEKIREAKNKNYITQQKNNALVLSAIEFKKNILDSTVRARSKKIFKDVGLEFPPLNGFSHIIKEPKSNVPFENMPKNPLLVYE